MQNKLDEAVVVFKQGLKSKDRTRTPLKILNNLATIEYRLKDYASAEAHLKAALDVDYDQTSPHNALGAIYGTTGKLDKAVFHFKECSRLNPGSPEPHFNLGTLYVGVDDLYNAEEQFNEALRIQPGHPGAINNMKVVQYRRLHGKK